MKTLTWFNILDIFSCILGASNSSAVGGRSTNK